MFALPASDYHICLDAWLINAIPCSHSIDDRHRYRDDRVGSDQASCTGNGQNRKLVRYRKGRATLVSWCDYGDCDTIFAL